MQDRFKFRVWDKKRKLYIYYGLIDIRLGVFATQNLLDADRFLIEQCTSLKDKNGTLIYEGDWLKTKDGYYCYVVWFEGFWWVKSLPSEAMDFEHSEFYGECEVIGNIHENADLLENKDE